MWRIRKHFPAYADIELDVETLCVVISFNRFKKLKPIFKQSARHLRKNFVIKTFAVTDAKTAMIETQKRRQNDVDIFRLESVGAFAGSSIPNLLRTSADDRI
jgi:hypothetical protein